jgi:hypothetical protein
VAPGGVAVGDVNGDDRPDLFIASGSGGNALYLQTDPTTLRYGDFTDIAGVGGDRSAASAGTAIADLDGDGDGDLYVCNQSGPDEVYLNDGGSPPRFAASAAALGLGGAGGSRFPAFADFDLDGDLDLFLLAAAEEEGPGTPGTGVPPTGRLLRNELVAGGARGPGGFVDVTARAGLAGEGAGSTVLWFDFNHDRFPDLFVAGLNGVTTGLFMNNGDGTFIDLAEGSLPSLPAAPGGADSGDLDGNGWPDLFVTAAGAPGTGEPGALYLNTGTPTFLEAANLAGLTGTGDDAWVRACDIDLDGRLDIITGGRSLSAWRQAGELEFEAVTAAWFPEQDWPSTTAALADLDRDGDLDLVVATTDRGRSVRLLRNSSHEHHSITVQLHGTSSQRDGIGARLVAETPDLRTQVSQIVLAGGYQSSGEPLAVIGTGPHLQVSRLTIAWPSGHLQVLENLTADRAYTVAEPVGPPPLNGQAPPARPAFTESRGVPDAVHREPPAADSANPATAYLHLTRLGPPVAAGDIDGDGDDDFFLGGGAGQSGSLHLNDGTGRFVAVVPDVFANDANCEDAGAVLFDADGDGDGDLFVASGGVRHPPGSLDLLDRLYLNRLRESGHPVFERAPPEAVPPSPESSSCVATADYDRDGDLDLFVASRVTPGRYPMAPANQLLVNRGDGTFDRHSDLAFAFTGATSSALWSDADGDGWPDLVTATEWGPVRVFLNREGRSFDLAPQEPGPTGWWNSLAAVDVDNDGDTDYVAGNLGLNSLRRASPDEPAVLYAGDLDGSGEFKHAEGRYQGEAVVPLPPIAGSTGGAGAPAAAIGEGDLSGDAYEFAATEFASGVFLNDGAGGLSFRPLPALAQLAPVFGIAVVELNGDSSADLVLAQGAAPPLPGEPPSTPCGCSLVLTGRGDGTFSPLPPAASGVFVHGDARSLAATDADRDGASDLLFGVNNGPAQLFLRARQSRAPALLMVQLRGPAGNPQAVGAVITFGNPHGTRQARELAAGSGYLTCSPASAEFGSPTPEPGVTPLIDVRWPDGTRTTHPAPGHSSTNWATTHTIPHPSLSQGQ